MSSPADADIKLLLDQVREIYGRTVYSHKTHIIQAGLDLQRHRCIKLGQIVLAAATTTGIIASLFGKDNSIAVCISAILSFMLTALIAYTKDFDLGTIAAEHKTTSDQLWNIREKYLDLITDIQSNTLEAEAIRTQRDALREELNKVYSAARITSSKAYSLAQKGLKFDEDMTFSSDEIDLLLPKGLRKNKNIKAPQVT